MAYSNSSLVHAFFHNENLRASTKHGSIFCENDKIYSYGYHFLMAQIIRNHSELGTIVLLNGRSYSPTTGKHQSLVRGANPYKAVYLPDLSDYILNKDNFKTTYLPEHLDNITNLIQKQQNARKKDYSREIDFAIEGLQVHYKLLDKKPRLSKSVLKLIKSGQLDENIQSFLDNMVASRKKAIQGAKRKRIADVKKQVKKWLNFEANNLPSKWEIRDLYKTDLIRLNPHTKVIETSINLSLSRVLALKAAKQIQAIKLGEYKRGQAPKVLSQYEVIEKTDKTIEIGCHLLALKDVIKYEKELKTSSNI